MEAGGEVDRIHPLPGLSWQVLPLMMHNLGIATATYLPGVPTSTPSHSHLRSMRLSLLHTELSSTGCLLPLVDFVRHKMKGQLFSLV